MDNFLRKMQLSENTIEIYLKSLGKFPLTYYELYTIVPKATPEEFNESLKELINAGLLVQNISKNQEFIIHYSPLPPILPILNYYDNINANLPNIKNSIHELMVNSVNRIFQENKAIELDSILNTFQEIRKDIEEDSIIQKQDVEDIVEGMEELKKVNKKFSDLHQNIKKITQTKFTDLIKTLNAIKKELLEKIKKKDIVSLIEQTFKEKVDKMIKDFVNTLHELIEKEFDETAKPIDKTTDLILEYRNDFKMLLLNMLTNFETKMNAIHEIIKDNNDNLSAAMKNLENIIIENINAVIQNSINEVSNLNKPIEILMKNYIQKINSIDKSIFSNIWIINSVTQINEAIQNLILNSKENLTLIIPHIENHLAPEQFEKIADNLKIKIASSEAHTNSIVKSFKNIKNLIYKMYENENLIILKGDNQIYTGVIQDSKDPLNNFIGIGSSFDPLITLLDPLVKDIWENAYSDTFHAAQVSKPQIDKITATTKTLTTFKPIISSRIQFQKVEKKPIKIETDKAKPTISIPSKIQEIPKDDKRFTKSQTKYTPSPTSPQPQITDLKQKLQDKIDFLSAAQPKAGDEAAIQINTAFTNLIHKLDNLKGSEFGKELQDIADLILEKKGFSVTLHKLRSTINKYKEKPTLLDAHDKTEIIENIDSWKKKIF
ncbi:MAG: hypothetical protein ACFFBV_02730 [Promethearchaeota archaeon]